MWQAQLPVAYGHIHPHLLSIRIRNQQRDKHPHVILGHHQCSRGGDDWGLVECCKKTSGHMAQVSVPSPQ